MAGLEQFAHVARAAVDDASQRLREAFGAPTPIEYKGAVDLVTAVDREVETLVAGALHAAFPDHLVVGEEASSGRPPARPRAGQYAWYLDPLDGTTNFAHRHPHFAVSLGLALDGALLLGLVADPLRGELFAAVHGQGATLNGEPIRVSHTAELDHALLATGLPYDRREHPDRYLGVIRAFVLSAQGIRRAGSAALDLCYLACGRFDGYWEWGLSAWDIAAGMLIVREAGGYITDLAVGDGLMASGNILAGNPYIHPLLGALVKEALDAGA